MHQPDSEILPAAISFGMVWWQWTLLIFFGLVLVAWAWARAYRRMVRKHLLRYLQETNPEFEILSEKSDHLIFRTPNLTQGRLNLHNLFSQLAAVKARTPEEERAVFKVLIAGLLENVARASTPMSLAADGEFLMPRLVNGPHLKELAASGNVVSNPVANIGLSVVYVRDSENAVRYLQNDDLGALGLDLPQLHEQALANLRKKTAPDLAQSVLKTKSLSLIKCGDTFDAARLLLLPEQLEGDEVLAAVIPDRDTLGILPPPLDGNWAALGKLARAVAGPVLLDKPLRVSRHGFERMDAS